MQTAGDPSLARPGVGGAAEPRTLFLQGRRLEEENLTSVTGDFPCDLLSDWPSSPPPEKKRWVPHGRLSLVDTFLAQSESMALSV